MLVIELDDSRFGAGPGTIIAHVATVAEYNALILDRDGARNPKLRLWEGNTPIGTRVVMKQYD